MKDAHICHDINQLVRRIIPKLRTIAKIGNLSYIATIITYFFEVGEMPNKKEFINKEN
jgi:hypothetical protein